MQIKFPVCLLMMILLVVIHACKRDEIRVPEQPKDISGAWRITKAMRNGVDITALADFTQFRIHFSPDGQYTLEHPLPFVVSRDGSYKLDDPKHPFRMSFRQSGLSVEISTSFTYPIVNGKRNLNLTFSPGCAANTYLYTLEKVAP
ncbi:DUF5004 domain-containing protein [uncultured Chitinophaga sp.]|jgi:hypothetical protein|uniref:DUF5004 domain-containing protein n=1 Tax=uncultured Chitinophaga sp. TaxID=339340 RepID=UPI002623ED3F|nr:DUF5004 domain-containing protein [uncultured Chitinophaga sp.]